VWLAPGQTLGEVDPLQAELATANARIVALEKEDNALNANNRVIEAALKMCLKRVGAQ